MAEQNIIIYSVAVEPSLSGFANGRGFFKGIAKISHGRYLSLGQAHLLPEVIIGGSAEELDLQKVEDEIMKEVKDVKTEFPTFSESKVKETVTKNLADRGVSTWHLEITHQKEKVLNEEVFGCSETLDVARANLKSASSVPDSLSAMVDSVSAVGISTTSAPSGFLSSVGNFFSSIASVFSPSTSTAVASNPLYSGSHDSYSSPLHETDSYASYESQEARTYKAEISSEQVERVYAKFM